MNHACKATSLTEPSSGGGLLLLRRKAPLSRRSVAYFCSGAHRSDFEKALIQQTPLGRAGQPDDIAGVVTFLSSEDAKWLTGELIIAGGGLR